MAVLSRQHGAIWNLIRAVKADTRPGSGAKGTELRDALGRTDDLRRRFIAHERAKQLYLWPVLRRSWPDGKAIGRAAWQRKTHAEERFMKLRWLSERDPRASEVLDQVLAAVEEHIGLEERLLGRMRRTLPQGVLIRAGTKLSRPGSSSRPGRIRTCRRSRGPGPFWARPSDWSIGPSRRSRSGRAVPSLPARTGTCRARLGQPTGSPAGFADHRGYARVSG